MNKEPVVASHSHSVSLQLLPAADAELATGGDCNYEEIPDSDITEHSAAGNTTFGSDVIPNGKSSAAMVAAPTVEKSFLR